MKACSECLCPVPEGPGDYPLWEPGMEKARFGESELAEALADGLVTLETLCVGVEKPESHYSWRTRINDNPEERARLFVYTAFEDWGEDRYYQKRAEHHGPVTGETLLDYTEPRPRDEELGNTWSDWSALSEPGPILEIMPTAALLYACKTGDLAVCEAALAAGAEIDPLYRATNALKTAVDNNQPAIVDRLMEKQRHAGPTTWKAVLGSAIVNGFHETLEALLRHKDERYYNDILTDLIRFSSDVAMAERLVEAGAEVGKIKDLPNNAIYTVVGYHTHEPDPPRAANAAELIGWFADKGVDAAQLDSYHGSAMHLAVERWNVPAIRKLVELGAPLDVKRGERSYGDSKTPQMIAQDMGKGAEFAALVGREWTPPAEPEPAPAPIRQPAPQNAPQNAPLPEPQPEPAPESETGFDALDPQEKARRRRLLRYIVGGLLMAFGLQIGITEAPMIGFGVAMAGAIVIGVALGQRGNQDAG